MEKAMPSQSDRESLALDAVKRYHSGYELENLRVADVYERWHHGSLYVINYFQKGDKDTEWSNYVYFRGREPRVFINSKEAFHYVGRTSHETSLAGRVLQIGGISGVIAFVMTVTICYLAITNGTPIPDVLSNALTTILGFYFGVGINEAVRRET
jgi:hypothetical protein